jgi:DNA-binding NarL/FixJ family response regulator
LLRGNIEAANATILRALSEVHEPARRTRVLEACVEIALAGNDVAGARPAAHELAEVAKRYDSPLLHAISARATGSVLLAEKEAKKALAQLRHSWTLFSELDAPYEAARTRLLIAQTCRELKHEDAAVSELTSAGQVFQQLGAAPDIARTESLLRKKACTAQGSLTEREVDVLRLVASGITNRGVAAKLRISEKTVARHVSNIFLKLDLTSRAAATAYAFQHRLV